jgi:predicted kinase
MATAHLLFGYLASGKSTFAKHLEVKHDAVRFTPDEWMARLFGDDPPRESFPAKAEAILRLLEPMWMRCLSLGVDVVLDYGFWGRKERDEVRAIVERLARGRVSTGSIAPMTRHAGGSPFGTGRIIVASI